MATIRNLGVMPAFASDFVLDDAKQGEPNCSQVIVFGLGYWGRGVNVHEAIINAQGWLQTGDMVIVGMCDAGAFIDDRGLFRYDARSTMFKGAITKANALSRFDVSIVEEVQPTRTMSPVRN